MSDRLAIEGGPKTVKQALPGVLSAEGRTFDRQEEDLVLEALRSGCLSRNGGTMVRRLEQEFASALGAEYAVACSSGTACVHLAVAARDAEMRARAGEEVPSEV